MLLVVGVVFFSPMISATWISPNNVNVQAKADVTYSADTGLYTYSYTFTNDTNSLLEVSDIIIPLNASIAINISAPEGWSSATSKDGVIIVGGTVGFSATGGDVPPDFVDTGTNIPPSPYQIRPGQTLSGFSFQSPDPPALVDFYAQGFTQIPELGVDEPDYDAIGVASPSILDASQSFKGQTKGPKYSDQLFLGGRRGAVDGFLAFRNIANRDTKVAPVQIDIEFGVNGETVDQNTFKAYLNSQEVTTDFKVTGPKTRRAVFQKEHLALTVDGRNTLLTTVQGVIPRSGRTAGDVDRVVFTVAP